MKIVFICYKCKCLLSSEDSTRDMIHNGDDSYSFKILSMMFPGGPLIFKCGYDAGTCIYKMDPKQVFPQTKKHTLNKYFCLFLLPLTSE